jgi:ATP-binding cassette subfamily F protein 3
MAKKGIEAGGTIVEPVARPQLPEAKPQAKETKALRGPAGNTVDRDLQKELQKHQRKLSSLEADLNKAKVEKQRLENALGDPVNYTDKQKFVSLEADYKKAQQHFESLNKEYETLFEKVLEMEG